MKPTEEVPEINAALKIVEATPEEKQILDYNGDNPRLLSLKATTTLMLCIEAMNKLYREKTVTKKKPIYFPWFWTAPGVGFSYIACVYGVDGYSGVASRLCFYERAHVKEVATNPYYLELYKQHHS